MNFTDKVILVTGAASGIGADTARRFASLGAKVVLVDVNSKGMSEVVEKIKGDKSATPLAITADLRTDGERVINEAIHHFGKLDVLVNNAAILCEKTIMGSSIDDFDRVMDNNLRSIVILTKLAVPHLANSGGNIVNVSSIAGIVPVKYAIYAMAKAALDQFTKCAANEFGPEGIRVNSVNPSFIWAPIFENSFSPELVAYFIEQCKVRYPVGRIGRADEVTAAIVFLASDEASFITGHQLAVDGGAISAGAQYMH